MSLDKFLDKFCASIGKEPKPKVKRAKKKAVKKKRA